VAASQLVGRFVAAAVGAMLEVLGVVGGIGVGQEIGDLPPQPFLLGLHPGIAHRLMPRGVGI
jgi:hypothetical protein